MEILQSHGYAPMAGGTARVASNQLIIPELVNIL